MLKHAFAVGFEHFMVDGRLPPAVTPASTHAGKPRIHDQKGYQG